MDELNDVPYERDDTLALIGDVALALVPGALIVYLSFNAGGFFPNTVGWSVVVVASLFALRALLVRRPFDGFDRRTAFVAVPLALLAAWTLLSGLWSDAPVRGLLEFDRTVLYLLVFLLLAAGVHTSARLTWMLRGIVAAIAVVCLVALVTRVLPEVWPIAPNLGNNRLSYPITYWNALGVLASVGIVLSFHLACASEESRVERILGAALIPVLSTTLLFTFSRGAIAVVVVGLLAYILIARPPSLLSGLLAAAPATALAVAVAYDANLLATLRPTTDAAVEQGHEVAATVAFAAVGAGALRALLLPLDQRLGSLSLSPRMRSLMLTAAAVALVVGALAVDLPASASRRCRAVHAGHPGPEHGRPAAATDGSREQRTARAVGGGPRRVRRCARPRTGRRHLRAPVGRRQAARMARGRGRRRPLALCRGAGGTRDRGAGIAGCRAGSASAAPGRWPAQPRPHALRRLVGGRPGVAPACRDRLGLGDAGCDRVAVRCGGRGERRAGGNRCASPGFGLRLAVVVACAAVAIPAGLVAASKLQLDDARRAFNRGDCDAAIAAADAARSRLSLPPESHQVLGYCYARGGLRAKSVEAMQEAIDRDPRNWEFRYGMAIVRGAAGLDPRPAASDALRLNPLEPLTIDLARRFRGEDPRGMADGRPAGAQGATAVTAPVSGAQGFVLGLPQPPEFLSLLGLPGAWEEGGQYCDFAELPDSELEPAVTGPPPDAAIAPAPPSSRQLANTTLANRDLKITLPFGGAPRATRARVASLIRSSSTGAREGLARRSSSAVSCSSGGKRSSLN